MKLYVVVHNKNELCTVQSRADAELIRLWLGSLGLVTRIRVRGAAYRTWPSQASPPLKSVLDQPTGDPKGGRIVRHVLLDQQNAVVKLLQRIAQLYQRLVQL